VQAEVFLDQVIDEDPGCKHRMDEGDLDGLKASLARDGLLQPIIVRCVSVEADQDTKYALVDGRRRVTAARVLKWTVIPACVYPPGMDDQTVRRLAAVANLERRDLNHVEEALAVVRLLEAITGRHADVWTDVDAAAVARAAEALGRSEAWVRDRAYLTRLCPDVRAMVADGRLPLAQAREVCKLASAEDQTDVASWAACDPNEAADPRQSVRIESVAKVRLMVAERLSTLRGVPWEPGVAFAGRPACDGCPDNSAHALLFGTDEEDKAPEARCLNTACYADKMKFAEKALAKEVSTLKARKGVQATAAAVRGETPEYLKAATVARHLAQVRGIEPKAKAEAKRPREVPYLERPEYKLQEAHRKWQQAVQTAVVSHCCANPQGKDIEPQRFACLAMLHQTRTWRRHVRGFEEHPSKVVRAKAEPLMARIASSDPAAALTALVADVDPKGLRTGLPVWVLRHLAGLLDVTLPREPVLEDFLPKAPAECETGSAERGVKKAKEKQKPVRGMAKGKGKPAAAKKWETAAETAEQGEQDEFPE
jgi:ParB/RepB/Spo0J family partition protein